MAPCQELDVGSVIEPCWLSSKPQVFQNKVLRRTAGRGGVLPGAFFLPSVLRILCACEGHILRSLEVEELEDDHAIAGLCNEAGGRVIRSSPREVGVHSISPQVGSLLISLGYLERAEHLLQEGLRRGTLGGRSAGGEVSCGEGWERLCDGHPCVDTLPGCLSLCTGIGGSGG